MTNMACCGADQCRTLSGIACLIVIAVFTFLPVFAFTACLAVLTTNVMFIGIAMALDAVVVIANAFLDVLAANVFLRMLMTTIAGVTTVVVAHMAGYAAVVMVAVKLEILVVIEGRRRPLVHAVALAAIAGDLLMQRVFWCLVAALAFIARGFFQQEVIEMTGRPEALHTGMVTVAGNAILAFQLLVEGCRRQRLLNGFAQGSQAADVFRFVTVNATPGIGTGEGCVTGETIRLKTGMTRNQFARPDHQVRIDEGQDGEDDQVRREDPLDRPIHTQPQKRKMLMM